MTIKKYNRNKVRLEKRQQDILSQTTTILRERWEEHEREDLKMIPEMEKRGWEPKFSPIDASHGRTHPWVAPEHPVEFVKDRTVCWKATARFTGYVEFKVADLVGNRFDNYRSYHKLSDVILNE